MNTTTKAKRLTRAQQIEARKLCAELPLIEGRLDAAGMHATARLVNQAIQRIGYELAEHLNEPGRS